MLRLQAAAAKLLARGAIDPQGQISGVGQDLHHMPCSLETGQMVRDLGCRISLILQVIELASHGRLEEASRIAATIGTPSALPTSQCGMTRCGRLIRQPGRPS